MLSPGGCEDIVIRTVTGDVESIERRILAHEHLQIDLSAQKGPANKVGEAEIPAVVEDLHTAKEFGLAAITDLSAPLWGRDPAALRRVSEATGISIVMGCGHYRDPYLDKNWFDRMDVDAIADDIVHDITEGVGGTGIRAGSSSATPTACQSPAISSTLRGRAAMSLSIRSARDRRTTHAERSSMCLTS